MRKILFFIGLILSFAATAQNTHVQNYQHTLSNGTLFTQQNTINQNGYGTYYTGGFNKYDSIKLTGFLKPDSILAEGNSITAGQGATTPSTGGYVPLIGTYYTIAIDNNALSGSGIWNSVKDHNQTHTPDWTVMTTVMAGFNDVRRNGAGALTTNKICGGLNSIFASQFLKSSVSGGSGTNITEYGTWLNTFTGLALGAKYNNGAFTSTLNDSIVYSFTDSTVIVGMMGADSSTNTYYYSIFDVYIDQVLQGHYRSANRADGVSDGVYDNHRSPFALIFTGLSNSAHTIKLIHKNTTSAYLVIDYFGHLRDAASAYALTVFEAPKMDATGYATSPALADDNVINAINASIDSTVALFPSAWKVYLVKTNDYYIANTSSGLSVDHIHPNDLGHQQIANAFYAVANFSTPPNGTLYTDLSHSYMVIGGTPLQLDNITNPISGTGTANTLAKFTATGTIGNSSISDNGTVIQTAEKIGIGVSPTDFFTAQGTHPSLRLNESASTTPAFFNSFTSFAQIAVNRDPATGTFVNTGASSALIQLEAASSNGKIHFYVSNSNNVTPVEQFTMIASSGVGRLGIGTTAPSERVHIIGSSSGPVLRLDDTSSANSNSAFVTQTGQYAVFSVNRSGTGLITNSGKATASLYMSAVSGEGQMQFWTGTTNNNVGVQNMTLNGTGRLLIGSTTDNATALVQITKTTAQQAWHYDATHYASITVNSSGQPTIGTTTNTIVLPAVTSMAMLTGYLSGTAPTSGSLGTNVTSVTVSAASVDMTTEVTVITSGAVSGKIATITLHNSPAYAVGARLFPNWAPTTTEAAGCTAMWAGFTGASTYDFGGTIAAPGTYVFYFHTEQ